MNICSIHIPKRSGVHLYVQVRIAGHIQPMLVPLMMQQVPVGDRSFMLRRYPRCFSGTDAISFFLRKRFARNEQEALSIGNALLKAGVFRHIKNEHLFRPGIYFYRFAAHEDYVTANETFTLRSSRMMSVACASFLSIPEIQRIDTAPVLHNSLDGSDSTLLPFDDSILKEDRQKFAEDDVIVETGIRIGSKAFPDLVTKFIDTRELIGKHVVHGKTTDKCFTGKAVTKWLIRNKYATTVTEAVGIGTAMLSSGVFYPLDCDQGGFNATHYRLIADTDISQELKRGARKDLLLKLLGINRGKAITAQMVQQSPWFEEQVSFSFTSENSMAIHDKRRK